MSGFLYDVEMGEIRAITEEPGAQIEDVTDAPGWDKMLRITTTDDGGNSSSRILLAVTWTEEEWIAKHGQTWEDGESWN